MTGPLHPRRPAAWGIVRWIAVLPVAAAAYLLVVTALIGATSGIWNLSGITDFTALFSIAMLVAVVAGAYTAPRHRARTAGLLILVLAGVFVFLTARAALSGIRDTSLPPVVLGQVAAGLVATFLVWWKERRRTDRRKPKPPVGAA